MNSKLLLIFTLAFLSILALAPTTAQDCSDSLNTYVMFTDHAEQNTLEVTQGDSVRLTSVARSYDGPLWYEKLEIVNERILFPEDEAGEYTLQKEYYLFTDTYTLDTSTLEPGTYTIKFTASTLTDCSFESETLTLIVESSEPPFVDDQCPIVNITFPIDGETYNELIDTANFDINENVQLDSCTYNLNGINYTIQNCINGSNTLTNLITEEGTNTLTVYATDNSSNTCSDSVSFNIEIPEKDTECPEVMMESPLDGETYNENLTEASFIIEERNFLDTDSCEFTLNGVTNSFDCKKGYNVIPISPKEGSNSLTIYVPDNSSNVCPKTINFNIEIPEPPTDYCPNVTITEPEDGKTYTDFIETLKFTIDEDYELTSCTYNLNGINYTVQNCIDGLNTIPISTIEGSNSLEVFATDNASQTCSDSISFMIDIPETDEQCPIITMNSPINGETYSNHLTHATFTITEENLLDTDSCEYTLNGITESFDCQKGLNTIPISTIEGSNSLTIVAKDEFGNSCPKTINFNIEIPEPPTDNCPEVKIVTPIDGKTYQDWKNNSIFTVNEDQELDSCEYTLNGQTFQIENCINGTNYLSDMNPLEGLNTLRVSATDNASQTCYDEITFNINITEEDENETDDQCPIVNITFPIDGETYNELIDTANFDINENVQLDSCTYNLNGINYTIQNCINGSNTLTNLITEEGTNTLTVYATDNSSNTCSDSVSFNIELDDDEDDNETCKDCCVEPDYYDYYYEENKTVMDYFWKGEDEKPIKLELKFNIKETFWGKLLNWLEELFS